MLHLEKVTGRNVWNALKLKVSKSQRSFVADNETSIMLAKHLSDNFVANHSIIPWKQIIRMRNLFAHHYGNTDYISVWDTAHDDIKELKSYLLSIIQYFGEESEIYADIL